MMDAEILDMYQYDYESKRGGFKKFLVNLKSIEYE